MVESPCDRDQVAGYIYTLSRTGFGNACACIIDGAWSPGSDKCNSKNLGPLPTQSRYQSSNGRILTNYYVKVHFPKQNMATAGIMHTFEKACTPEDINGWHRLLFQCIPHCLLAGLSRQQSKLCRKSTSWMGVQFIEVWEKWHIRHQGARCLCLAVALQVIAGGEGSRASLLSFAQGRCVGDCFPAIWVFMTAPTTGILQQKVSLARSTEDWPSKLVVKLHYFISSRHFDVQLWSKPTWLYIFSLSSKGR